MRFAAAIFHIRWRPARNRFASHAPRSRLCTDRACELDVCGADPPIINTTLTSLFLAGVSGLLLIPGLWTPIVSGLVALLQIWQMMTITGDRWVPLLLGTIGGTLAMLGPGLWSVDARLFGWKRVEPAPRKISSNSLKDSFINHRNFWLNGGY